MTCYRATERAWAGEGPCQPGERCIWGCALYDHWERQRVEKAAQAAEWRRRNN